ncbi:hypothetical protein [Desulfobacter postgatei]|uniref:hypothetical protein n=1 Tax=Desulfobacter postgatei TaxID=2293 RepID=UPI002FDA573D
MRTCKACGVWLNNVAHGPTAEYCSDKCEMSGPGAFICDEDLDLIMAKERIAVLEAKLDREVNKNKKLMEALTPVKVAVQSATKNKKDSDDCRKIKDNAKKEGCVLCGYKKCLRALEFHHVVTKWKSISSIHDADLLLNDLERNPVVVLCANCHREIHHSLRDVDLLSKVINASTLADRLGLSLTTQQSFVF